MDKRVLRRELRSRLRARSAAEHRDDSAALVDRLRAELPAGAVAVYVPLPEEPDLGPLLGELARAGRLVLPRVLPVGLALHPVGDLGALVPAGYGLTEPCADSAQCTPASLSAVVVPGLGFTVEGVRLGRGRGDYDRLIASLPEETLLVSVLFPEQLCAELPELAHDRRVHRLVLPDRVIDCQR